MLQPPWPTRSGSSWNRNWKSQQHLCSGFLRNLVLVSAVRCNALIKTIYKRTRSYLATKAADRAPPLTGLYFTRALSAARFGLHLAHFICFLLTKIVAVMRVSQTVIYIAALTGLFPASFTFSPAFPATAKFFAGLHERVKICSFITALEDEMSLRLDIDKPDSGKLQFSGHLILEYMHQYLHWYGWCEAFWNFSPVWNLLPNSTLCVRYQDSHNQPKASLRYLPPAPTNQFYYLVIKLSFTCYAKARNFLIFHSEEKYNLTKLFYKQITFLNLTLVYYL